MFIWTARVNRRRVALTLVGVLAVCGIFLSGTLLLGRGAAVSGPISPRGVKTEEDRANYLSQWGWLTAPEPTQVEELELPREFTADYDAYLALQQGQGFDLAKYAGKRVKRYTYDVLNYPGGLQGVQVHLLLCKNRVVGGEVFGDGFLHGLEMPAQ